MAYSSRIEQKHMTNASRKKKRPWCIHYDCHARGHRNYGQFLRQPRGCFWWNRNDATAFYASLAVRLLLRAVFSSPLFASIWMVSVCFQFFLYSRDFRVYLGFSIFFCSKHFNLDTAFYYFHPVVKESLIYNLSGESFFFFFLDPCPSFETSSSVWTSAFQGTSQSSLNIFRVSSSLWKSSFLSLSGEALILLSHDFLIHTNLAPSPVHGLSTVKFPGAFYIFNLQFLLNVMPLSLSLWSHIVTIILQFSSCHQVSD